MFKNPTFWFSFSVISLLIIIVGLLLLQLIKLRKLSNTASLQSCLNSHERNTPTDDAGGIGDNMTNKKNTNNDETQIYPTFSLIGWVSSVYDLRSDWVSQTATANIPLIKSKKDLGEVTLVVLCNFVDVKGDRARIRIADPFETMFTETFSTKTFNTDELSLMAGRILVIKGIAADGKLCVKGFSRTVYGKKIS